MIPDLKLRCRGKSMPTNLVNLDALIPREDFEVVIDASPFDQKDTISIVDLQQGFFYSALRKPDFQRETASWSPLKIADLVASFLNGDLIPAIILWQPPAKGGSIFVIDGAHRLSALIAWVRNDFGDDEVSRNFFQNNIPDDQIKAAEKTRKLINDTVGSYKEHVAATSFPENTRQEVIERSKRLASLAVKVQWVNGNADKAEASFFKINQEATPIDPTELIILESRHTPSAITARAIIRAGKGHKYWERFLPQTQTQIEATAKDIHTNLFSPPLKTPIKTLDLPVAGREYSAATLPLIFDFVNLVNDQIMISKEKYQTARNKKKKGKKGKEGDEVKDLDGQKTVGYLTRVRQLAYRISGVHASSLGLHPAIYFYSTTGRHQPPAFLAVAGFVKELVEKGRLNKFTERRAKFEDFLLAHKEFVNQVVGKFGGGFKSYDRLKEMYHLILDGLIDGKNESEILAALENHPELYFLKATPPNSGNIVTAANFSANTKSAVFMRDALAQPRERCGICTARLHVNSIQIDHVQRKADGGLGALDNAQLSHPYCNSTYKH